MFHFFLEHFSIYLMDLDSQILLFFFPNRNEWSKTNMKHAGNIVQFTFMCTKISYMHICIYKVVVPGLCEKPCCSAVTKMQPQ